MIIDISDVQIARAIHRNPDTPPPDGAVAGTITRVTHLGFEVKVDVALADGSGEDCWVQLSRGTADAYLALAALVGDGLATSRRAEPSPGPAEIRT